MNNPSPLVPQGVTPPRGKSSLCFKVLMIVMVHVVVIGGMLLQGCKDTSSKDQTSSAVPTNDTSVAAASNTIPTADVPATLNPNISNSVTVAAPQTAPMTSLAPQAKPSDLAPAPAPSEGKEYVIAKGDTLAAIAHKNGLSLKSLMDANPGVNAKKLKIGQKVQIPGGTAAVAAVSAPGATPDAVSAEGAVYVVKSGDMLVRIAKTHGTTVKKIMALNDLKTTSIRAGQKLKLPAAKTAEAAPATASVAPTQPAAQMRVSATMPVMPSPVASN